MRFSFKRVMSKGDAGFSIHVIPQSRPPRAQPHAEMEKKTSHNSEQRNPLWYYSHKKGGMVFFFPLRILWGCHVRFSMSILNWMAEIKNLLLYTCGMSYIYCTQHVNNENKKSKYRKYISVIVTFWWKFYDIHVKFHFGFVSWILIHCTNPHYCLHCRRIQRIPTLLHFI